MGKSNFVVRGRVDPWWLRAMAILCTERGTCDVEDAPPCEQANLPF
jgi:hypothetical protein